MTGKESNQLNVMIVDDESAVRNTILRLLEDHFPAINVSATAGSVEEAFQKLEKYRPDLLLLDVELPDGNAFDLLERIRERDFRIIFITGHQEYALAAFKVSALDYILKPLDPDEFQQAVDKALKIHDRREENLRLNILEENLRSRKTLKRIILPTSEHLHVVKVEEIIRAEADSNYTTFWLKGGEHIMVSRTIKEFDELLSTSGMLRVHQSHLVNVHCIKKYARRDGGYLIMEDKSTVPVSQGLKKRLLKAIQSNLRD